MLIRLALASWLAVALAGAIYSDRLLRQYHDLREAVPLMRRNGIRKRLAQMWTTANVVEERMSLAKHLISFVIGLAAIPLPPAQTTRGHIFRLVVSAGLVAINVLSMVRSRYRWVKWNEWRAVVLAEHAKERTVKRGE